MINPMNAQEIIEYFRMRPLPEEGGWYTETYRATELISKSGLDARYCGDRCHSTSILYLLTAGMVSKTHRVKSDEIFHYHLGDPVRMLQLYPDGSGREVVIGPDIMNGQQIQVVVPKMIWQGSRLADGGKWCLMSCTVAPGFEFEDYEHGQREALIQQWPDYASEIQKLT